MENGKVLEFITFFDTIQEVYEVHVALYEDCRSGIETMPISIKFNSLLHMTSYGDGDSKDIPSQHEKMTS